MEELNHVAWFITQHHLTNTQRMVNLFKLLLTSAGILSVISLLKQNYSIHSEIQSLSDSDLILTLSLPGIIIYQQNELMI